MVGTDNSSVGKISTFSFSSLLGLRRWICMPFVCSVCDTVMLRGVRGSYDQAASTVYNLDLS